MASASRKPPCSKVEDYLSFFLGRKKIPNKFSCQQGYLYLWKLPCFETESELAADIVVTVGPFIQVWDELCRLQVIIRSQNNPLGVYNIRNLSFWR